MTHTSTEQPREKCTACNETGTGKDGFDCLRCDGDGWVYAEPVTHTDTELLPCPFCGAKAHFDIDDENWEWIECEGCGMQGNRSASLMEDCKPKLREAWNRRTTASQAQRVPLALYQRDTIKANAWRETVTGGYWDVNDIIDATEAAHGITQEKQG